MGDLINCLVDMPDRPELWESLRSDDAARIGAERTERLLREGRERWDGAYRKTALVGSTVLALCLVVEAIPVGVAVAGMVAVNWVSSLVDGVSRKAGGEILSAFAMDEISPVSLSKKVFEASVGSAVLMAAAPALGKFTELLCRFEQALGMRAKEETFASVERRPNETGWMEVLQNARVETSGPDGKRTSMGHPSVLREMESRPKASGSARDRMESDRSTYREIVRRHAENVRETMKMLSNAEWLGRDTRRRLVEETPVERIIAVDAVFRDLMRERTDEVRSEKGQAWFSSSGNASAESVRREMLMKALSAAGLRPKDSVEEALDALPETSGASKANLSRRKAERSGAFESTTTLGLPRMGTEAACG